MKMKIEIEVDINPDAIFSTNQNTAFKCLKNDLFDCFNAIYVPNIEGNKPPVKLFVGHAHIHAKTVFESDLPMLKNSDKQ